MNPSLPALRGIWLMARMRCLRQRNFLQHTLLRGFGINPTPLGKFVRERLQ
ncbi:MAG: hypothetical protein K2P77_02810 [Burkholderiaceae bacterium]|nr:hypothetical protein [Burkholderiaceae bacterium]